MKYQWIKQDHSSRLILFFHGWGMTPACLRFLKSQSDLLIIYTYSSLSLQPEILKQIENYSEIFVIGWSFGVWVMKHIIQEIPEVSGSVVINGTYRPVDRHYGIHPMIFRKTLENQGREYLKRFYRNMFLHDEEYDRFIKQIGNLCVDEVYTELQWFANQFEMDEGKGISFQPDRVIMSKYDRIIPYRSQERFWENHPNIKVLEKGHFPFFNWNSWEELLNL